MQANLQMPASNFQLLPGVDLSWVLIDVIRQPY